MAPSRRIFMAAMLAGLATVASSQDKKGNEERDRISGVVHEVDRGTKTITVRSRGTIHRKVIYTDQTRYTTRNTSKGSVEDLREGARIISIGKFDDKGALVAARIDFR
ncbi:MAG: hypothetical protein SFV54_02875 [Bryobacteraceae bacterium]|nr:hypothetical protein [Bryobacteraceae bacterium]